MKRVNKRSGRSGRSGRVLKTLSFGSLHGVVRKAVGSLAGWGDLPPADLKLLCKPASLLLIGLGPRVCDPYEVDRVLEEYRQLHSPCKSTFDKTSRHVRAYAFAKRVPDLDALFPEDAAEVKCSELAMPALEESYAGFLAAHAAPTEPDAEIAAAWEITTFLKECPTDFELSGPVPLPVPAKFRARKHADEPLRPANTLPSNPPPSDP